VSIGKGPNAQQEYGEGTLSIVNRSYRFRPFKDLQIQRGFDSLSTFHDKLILKVDEKRREEVGQKHLTTTILLSYMVPRLRPSFATHYLLLRKMIAIIIIKAALIAPTISIVCPKGTRISPSVVVVEDVVGIVVVVVVVVVAVVVMLAGVTVTIT
jgi:hypothetical protein